MRFVLSPEGEVLPDIDSRLPGRGAYTCISSRCLETALKQRQFGRAFKRDVTVASAQEMVDRIAALIKGRILGYVGLANRAGKVVSGSSMVCDALRGSAKPALVMVATDVSAAIGEKVEILAAHQRTPCQRVLAKDDYGDILGKAPRSAIAIKTSGFAAQLSHEIERYRNFLGEVQNL